MTEEKKPTEAPKVDNPPKQDTPKPAGEQLNPSDKGSEVQDSKTELTAALKLVDRYKDQVKGSSEEALKLKQDLEDARSKIEELSVPKPTAPTNDEEFKQRVNEVGYAKAIREIVNAAVEPLQERTQALVDKDVNGILDNFKSNHPGLKDEILTKFDKEFDRLKSVYSTPQEAMDAAYAVIGGLQADETTKQPAKEAEKAEEIDTQHKIDKVELAGTVGGSPESKKTGPRNDQATVDKQIADLRAIAMQREANGQDATELWVKHEVLKQDQLRKST